MSSKIPTRKERNIRSARIACQAMWPSAESHAATLVETAWCLPDFPVVLRLHKAIEDTAERYAVLCNLREVLRQDLKWRWGAPRRLAWERACVAVDCLIALGPTDRTVA